MSHLVSLRPTRATKGEMSRAEPSDADGAKMASRFFSEIKITRAIFAR